MKAIMLTIVACLLAIGAKPGAAANASGLSLVEPVLLQLIAAPDRYDGQRVRVTGYCSFEFEGTEIYMNRDDFLHMLSAKLWLDTPPDSKREPHYCIVEGKFDAKQKGHLGAAVGSITNINRIEAWPGR